MKLFKAISVFLGLGVGVGVGISSLAVSPKDSMLARRSVNQVKHETTSQRGDDCQGLIDELRGNDETRRAAREELIRLGADAVPALIAATKRADRVLRWEAVNVLGITSDSRSTDALLSRVLKDEDTHVRWRSIWAISSMDRRKVVPSLVEALASEEQQTVWHAAVALAALGRDEGLFVLYEGLKSGDSFSRWEATHLLASVSDVNTLPALLTALRDPDGRVVGEAARSLGRIKDRRVIPSLIEVLNCPHPTARIRAAQALAQRRAVSAVPRLQERLSAETDRRVRQALSEALARLKESSENATHRG